MKGAQRLQHQLVLPCPVLGDASDGDSSLVLGEVAPEGEPGGNCLEAWPSLLCGLPGLCALSKLSCDADT